MNARTRSLHSALVALVVAAGCGPATTVVPAPALLSEVLAPWEAPADVPGVELRLEVRDALAAPVPHALVHFAWPEGGRTAFQSDAQGVLWVRLPDARPQADPRIEVRTLPEGQDLLAADYDEISRALDGATLAVRFAAYTPGPQASAP